MIPIIQNFLLPNHYRYGGLFAILLILVLTRIVSPDEVLWWRSTDTAGLLGTIPDHFAVDSARHTVVQLRVQLRQDVLLVHRCLGNVPDSRRLDNVPDDKLLNRLVLGNAAGAVCATHGLHMSTVVLAASSITPFLGLQCTKHTKSISGGEVWLCSPQ